MDKLPLIISGFTGAAGRFGGIAALILQDRLELLSLELREAKIGFIQALLLACMGMIFSLLGLLLLAFGFVYVLAPEWRIYGLTAAAGISILAGAGFFIILRRRLIRKPLAFDQSLSELKKDMACFSKTN
jgi:uncharacterized membrane protein YqjE